MMSFPGFPSALCPRLSTGETRNPKTPISTDQKKKKNPPESAHELKDQERGGLKDKIMRPNAGEDVGTGSLKSWKLLWQLL